MKKFNIELPDKIFGQETLILLEYLPLGGLIILLLVTWSLIISPKIEDINEIRAKVSTLAKETALVTTKNNYLRSVDQDQLNKNSELLANSLIKEKNSYYLVGVVRDLAARNNFSVVSFTVSPGELGETEEEKKTKAKKEGDVVPLPIRVTLNGPSENYDKFISDLERSIPILSIGGLDMKQGGGVVLMEMSVTSYYAKERKDISSSKLSLNDLVLSKEEESVLSRIGEFNVFAKAGGLEETEESQKEFVKYQRENPFSL